MSEEVVSVLIFVAGVAVVILAILWTILPFMVYQIQKTSGELLSEVKHLNKSIATIRKEMRGK